jgi:hypothetical protein
MKSEPSFLAVVFKLKASEPEEGSVNAKLLTVFVANRGKYCFFCSSFPNLMMTLLISVFWRSTKIPTEGSTFESSSTHNTVVMKLQPEPPYSGSTWTPINPLLKSMSITESLNLPSSSIALTWGAICSWANRATVSFIASSSSLRVVRGKCKPVAVSTFGCICCSFLDPLNMCRTAVLLPTIFFVTLNKLFMINELRLSMVTTDVQPTFLAASNQLINNKTPTL